MKNGYWRWQNIFSFAVIGLTFAFLCMIAVCMLWPYQTATVKDVHTLTPIVKVGEEAVFEFTYDKKTSHSADFSIGLANHSTYNVASGTVDSPEGIYTTQKSIIIPPEVAPGEYRIRVTMKYKVNPIRTIAVEFETEDTFEVLGNE